VRCAWFSDFTGSGGTGAAVQPTVWSPMEAVGKVVIVGRRNPEAVEHDLRRAVGNAIVVAIGKKQQLWRAERPNSAVAKLDAGELLYVVGEDLPLVKAAIVVAVFEDEDAIAQV